MRHWSGNKPPLPFAATATAALGITASGLAYLIGMAAAIYVWILFGLDVAHSLFPHLKH